MSAITLASSVEMIAMLLEVSLYLGHVVIWSKFDTEQSSAFMGLFFALSMFAVSNAMYSLLGMRFCPYGGTFEYIAGAVQFTGAWMTAISMGVIVWREFREHNSGGTLN